MYSPLGRLWQPPTRARLNGQRVFKIKSEKRFQIYFPIKSCARGRLDNSSIPPLSPAYKETRRLNRQVKMRHLYFPARSTKRLEHDLAFHCFVESGLAAGHSNAS